VNTRWLVAIDDTDNEESIGTGRLARMLAAHLVTEGLLREPSVTRHQLLVHPDVPYTSHNSSACIAAEGGADAGEKLLELATRFLQAHEHTGANPGLLVMPEADVPAGLVALGRRAQQVVLDLAAFDAEIAPHGLRLWSAGATGQGRIGAVCGAALRSTGEDGRFIDLAGIRALGGRARVGEILARTGVASVTTPDGEVLADDVAIETRDWIRPSLLGGLPVFQVRRDGADWVPAERHKGDDG
jgi:hypothetical protein